MDSGGFTTGIKCTYHFSFNPHTVPERFNPLPAQNSEDHHERMKEIGKVPPKKTKQNRYFSSILSVVTVKSIIFLKDPRIIINHKTIVSLYSNKWQTIYLKQGIEQKDMTFDHDFCYSFSFSSSPCFRSE